ncbi:MAG TPA: class I mannose-6-phosphate isomerase, partial [Bacteroidales bacterium]|nr:class I mannose-6-phosphate isomerase [Bacteroidales bacterium]
DVVFNASDAMLPEDEIRKITFPDVTDDRIFGFITRLSMDDFYDPDEIESLRAKILAIEKGTILIYGSGAAKVYPDPDLLVYADMARWEIQKRMRRNAVSNLGIKNYEESFESQYKRAYFVDWRVCDRLKKEIMDRWDFILDTNMANHPVMVTADAFSEAMKQSVNQPFSVVPYFDAGPWGGQWMKETFDLDRSTENYAWCFNCVPEENSLFLRFGEHRFETPSINLVFTKPAELLGLPVYGRFGDEFPIRFDFLDTIGGGNLSLQVHPLTEYIQEKFGMNYTQDESYYILEAEEKASVFLGLKEGVDPGQMISDLKEAQESNTEFDAATFIQNWPAKRHDHFLIPGGTIHCSAKGCMVLEISATPYIFTFKLWDWGRLGMDGKPRPINIGHGIQNIQWDRTENWVHDNLVNRTEKLGEGDGWREEKTGLHELEFIETRRHWFTGKVPHHTNDGVNVLALVEGREIIVESPSASFDPFVVHFAETFIVPATVGEYTIRPYGESEGKECATVKAYVRVNG